MLSEEFDMTARAAAGAADGVSQCGRAQSGAGAGDVCGSIAPDVQADEESDEMFEHFSIVVDKGQSLLRLDKFLTCRMENTSRNRIQAPQLLCLISRII